MKEFFRYARNGDIEGLKRLLNSGVNIDSVDDIKNTALMWAVSSNKLEPVKFLVSKGASLNLRDEQGRTAFSFAVEYGNNDVIIYLAKKGADVSIAEDMGSDRGGRSPLMIAVQKELPMIVRLILSKGVDVNYLDSYHSNALHYACSSGKWTDESLDSISIVKQLIEKRIDVNWENEYGMTPLMLAAKNGRIEITKLLLLHNANPLYENWKGETVINHCRYKNIKDLILYWIKEDEI